MKNSRVNEIHSSGEQQSRRLPPMRHALRVVRNAMRNQVDLNERLLDRNRS